MNLTSLVTALAAIGLARALYQRLFRLSEYTPNDVLAFLHQFDMEKVYGAFHPEVEERMRRELSPRAFKEFQWKRFLQAIFYCGLLAANSRVFQGWTLYARRRGWKNFAPPLKQTITELRSACMQCRLAALVIGMRLRWWVLKMRLMPWRDAPSFNALFKLGSGDMVAFYDKARAMAEIFSLAYGEEYHRKLAAILQPPF
jgi:hypothetical protein